jgi:hypothetical protein
MELLHKELTTGFTELHGECTDKSFRASPCHPWFKKNHQQLQGFAPINNSVFPRVIRG